MTGVPALFTRHRGLARSIADGYFWAGAEKQDIRQEAEIGLWIACRNWDPAGGASFRTFADMVVRRRLVTMLQVALREKHRPMDEALTGTVGVDDGAELLVELLPSALDTERVVVARDTLTRLCAATRFRKKPVEIEAIRWDGTEECLAVVLPWINFDSLPDDGIHVGKGVGYVPALGTLDIPTLEGVMTASPGDWIIRGVKGEFYPCKPDIFEMTYEPAAPEEAGK